MPDIEQPDTAEATRKTKRARITAACAVCRAKRQKCSGEKPICEQCRTHNEDCWWSDQKKRGPAKDYLRSLQDRLQETERLLIGVLNKVSDADVQEVLDTNAADTTTMPSHQTWLGALSGPDYWSQYPLGHVEAVREWQRQRLSDVPPASERPVKVARTSARNGAVHGAPDVTMAAPTAVMTSNTEESHNGSQPYYENGYDAQFAIEPSLRNPPPDRPVSHARRYSEETRDVAQALYSISNQGERNTRQQQPQTSDPPQTDPQPDDEEAKSTAPKADASSEQFPKHLFW